MLGFCSAGGVILHWSNACELNKPGPPLLNKQNTLESKHLGDEITKQTAFCTNFHPKVREGFEPITFKFLAVEQVVLQQLLILEYLLKGLDAMLGLNGNLCSLKYSRFDFGLIPIKC